MQYRRLLSIRFVIKCISRKLDIYGRLALAGFLCGVQFFEFIEYEGEYEYNYYYFTRKYRSLSFVRNFFFEKKRSIMH